MTIMNDIRACLDTHLLAMPGVPQIAQQNLRFDATTGVPYIRADMIPTLRRPAVRGLNPQQRYDGLYNLLICVPEGLGSGAGYDIADNILSWFQANTDITYNLPLGGQLILSLEFSEVRTSFLDTPFYCTPVTIAWYCYSQ